MILFLMFTLAYVVGFACGNHSARFQRYTISEVDDALFRAIGAGVRQIAAVNDALRKRDDT